MRHSRDVSQTSFTEDRGERERHEELRRGHADRARPLLRDRDHDRDDRRVVEERRDRRDRHLKMHLDFKGTSFGYEIITFVSIS